MNISIAALAFLLACPLAASAMHIMEGYLPLGYCVAWAALCVPFLLLGLRCIRSLIVENKRALILLAMSGAFIFVISSLKIPSVTGSCSHMTGTGLAAILFGAPTASILGLIVLLFQAIMLAHGGLMTLGANTFSMAIAGPVIAWLLFKFGKGIRLNLKLNVFIAAFFGDFITYCFTSVQLALAYPSEVGGVAASLLKFLAVFAPTQLPLAVVEGILTVLIIIGMESFARQELKSISFMEN